MLTDLISLLRARLIKHTLLLIGLIFCLPDKAYAADVRGENAESLIMRLACIRTLEELDKSGSVFGTITQRQNDNLYLVFSQMPEDTPVCGRIKAETPENIENLKKMIEELLPAVDEILAGKKANEIDIKYFLQAVLVSNIDKKLSFEKGNPLAAFKLQVDANEEEAYIYARLALAALGKAFDVNALLGGIAAGGEGLGDGVAGGIGGGDGEGAIEGGAFGAGPGAATEGPTPAEGAPGANGGGGGGGTEEAIEATTSTVSSSSGSSDEDDEDSGPNNGCKEGEIFQNNKCVEVPLACANLTGILLEECTCLNKDPAGTWDDESESCSVPEDEGDGGDENGNDGNDGEGVDLGGDDENGGSSGSSEDAAGELDENAITEEELDELLDELLLDAFGSDDEGGNGIGLDNEAQGDEELTEDEATEESEENESNSGSSGFDEDDFFGGSSSSSSSSRGSGSGGVSGNSSASVGSSSSGVQSDDDPASSDDEESSSSSNNSNDTILCDPGQTLNPQTNQCETCSFDSGGNLIPGQAGCDDLPPVAGSVTGINVSSTALGGGACDESNADSCAGGNISAATGDILASISIQTNQAVQSEIYGLIPPSPVYTYRNKGYNPKYSDPDETIELSAQAKLVWDNDFSDEAKAQIFGGHAGLPKYRNQYVISDKTCIMGDIAFQSEGGERVAGINPVPEIKCNIHAKMWEMAVRDALDHVSARVKIEETQRKLNDSTDNTTGDLFGDLYKNEYRKSLTSAQKELLGYRQNLTDYDVDEDDGYQKTINAVFFTESNSDVEAIYENIQACNQRIKDIEGRIANCLVYGTSQSGGTAGGTCAIGEVTSCKIQRMESVNKLIKNKLKLEECMMSEISSTDTMSILNCTLDPPADYDCENSDAASNANVACLLGG